MFENLGFQEIALIAVVFIVFFGPKKIPEVMNGIGRGVREFRRAMNDVKDEISNITTSPVEPTIHKQDRTGTTIQQIESPRHEDKPTTGE